MAQAFRVSAATFRALWFDHRLTKADIAARLGCGDVTVWRLAKGFGFGQRRRGGAGKLDDARLRALYASGVRPTQIAAMMGRSRGTIEAAIRRLDLPRQGRGLPPVLVADDLFIAMWRAGVRLCDMAAHFGVSIMSVRTAARNAGMPARGNAKGRSVTLADWQARVAQDALRAAMAADALAVRRAMRDAGMVDRIMSASGLDACKASAARRVSARGVAA